MKLDKINKIILPIDVITAEGLDKNRQITKKTIIKIKSVQKITKNEMIVDIGPETIQLFSQEIKTAQTLVWNGPMGMFEVPNFKQGTVIIARMLAIRSFGRAYGIAGGGETVEAIGLSKMGHYFDWVSTGGGAMLAYLSGDKMPGLVGLIKK
jgi:phosphoglycerate kinase